MKIFSIIVVAGLLLVSAPSIADEATFTDHQICRAAIATIMHKDVSITSASGEEVISVSYRSEYLKKFKCRLQGSRVMWGAADGRWRDHPMDEKVMWEAKGEKLIIRQPWSDGSVSEDEFDRDQL